MVTVVTARLNITQARLRADYQFYRVYFQRWNLVYLLDVRMMFVLDLDYF